MTEPRRAKVVCLTNIFDENYYAARGEPVERPLTIPFRRDLFHCLEVALGREVILLSCPPKAADRRRARWLPAMETQFCGHRQFFCPNWDVPKLRIPLSWMFYARHVLRHVRSGDLIVIDNYEIIYVIAARVVNWVRRVRFLLVYLDGKHLIDRGWNRMLSSLAEAWGRRLLSAAVLSTPALGERLPDSLPREVVPGFVPDRVSTRVLQRGQIVRFLYAGTLAHSHGVDLLLESLHHMPAEGWQLTIAGQGPLTEQVIRASQDPRWQTKLQYLPAMPSNAFEQLLGESHIGLNCQRMSTAISAVTFPSKVFTYLSAGLLVISSRASTAPLVCGEACQYYDGEYSSALAETCCRVMASYQELANRLASSQILERYTIEQTAERLRQMLSAPTLPSTPNQSLLVVQRRN